MIKLINCPYGKNKKRKLVSRLRSFLRKENIVNIFDEIKLDWTPQKTVNQFGGYYGGFFSLYNNRKAYINLTVFYELNNLNDLNQILWAVYHELIHCKQMSNKEIDISSDASSLTYKNKTYKKLSFRNKTFLDLYEEDPKKATEYHINEIPWESECYYKSDLYTGRKSFNHKIHLED